MMRRILLCLTLLPGVSRLATAREAKLVRYPDYHAGKVAFAYLGDIWTADEDGKNIQRLTVHTARDITRGSPRMAVRSRFPPIARGTWTSI